MTLIKFHFYDHQMEFSFRSETPKSPFQVKLPSDGETGNFLERAFFSRNDESTSSCRDGYFSPSLMNGVVTAGVEIS